MVRVQVKQIRDDIEQALAPLEKKWGVVLTIGGARFNQDSVMFTKLTMTAVTADGAPRGIDVLCQSAGLDPDSWGKVFEHENQLYSITDIVLKRPKFPVLVTRLSDKKRFKFPTSLVKVALELGK